MSSIKFGTDGWRAVLGETFNEKNVEKVINAIAIYVYQNSGYEKSFIVGYDPRNKADEYAVFIAELLAKFGFRVELSNRVVATPVLAYCALKKNAYAIMITASHNPSEYLGIKFIPPYGGPAEDIMVNEISNNIENKFSVFSEPKEVKQVYFDYDYILHVKKLIDTELIKKSGIEINYDGHHGAAASIFLRILDEIGIKYNAQNIERDINFGGYLPDPKEEYLPELKKLCQTNGKIGLSNDGDGDRFGVFDEKGSFISPNDIIAMLLKHLIKNRKFTGKLAKTVGASGMLDLYARKYEVDIIETPVGFKWLGSAMRNNDVIIAGEESGGLSIKGHIPEKDGILANLLIMELIAYSGKNLNEIHSEFLKEVNKKFINKRIDLKLNSTENQDEIIEKTKKLKQICGVDIVKYNDIDGLKLYLKDNSSILIRKSGTEPLLRIYFESDSEDKIENMKKSFI